jgi:hypothetical protein
MSGMPPEAELAVETLISADGEVRNFTYTREDALAIQNANYRHRYLELEELLEYAVEMGKLTPDISLEEIKNLKKLFFYTPSHQSDVATLCRAEAQLEWHYNQIAVLVAPVTSCTLRATSEDYPVVRNSRIAAYFLGDASVANNCFRQMLWIAMGLVGLMFYFRLFGEPNTIHYMDPFLFGAVGSLIYLYKALNECHTNRTFDPSKMTTDRLRLFMGALSGGLIVNLFDPSIISGANDVAQAGATAQKSSTFSAAALGFLAGYSVDFFYGTLDRLIKNLLPPRETPEVVNTNAVMPSLSMIPKPAPISPAPSVTPEPASTPVPEITPVASPPEVTPEIKTVHS